MEVWTAAEFDTTRSGVMYIRKRISPSRRQTPSYQVLETYRESMTGKVKQRVLMNLGACPDLQTALKEARQQRRQQRTAGTVPSKDLADRIRALERLISKWPRRLSPETTERVPPVKPRSNDYDLAAAQRVRECRIALGLTLQEIAARAGVSYQAAYKYETGVNRMSVGRLVTIATALGTTASALLDEIELAKPRPGRLRRPSAWTALSRG
jgi:DNA-binding XRE family transcriptional regulator